MQPMRLFDSEYGRIKLYTDAREITERNVLDEFYKAYHYHNINALKELELLRYERGDQPIRDRKKDIRPEINERIVINTASQIVDTHVGYCFGNPITYVQRAKIENDERKPKTSAEEDNIRIATLNKMMVEQGKPEADIELARYMHICGVGYQMAWMNDRRSDIAPFKLTTLNPLTTFVVYRNDPWREPVMGCTFIFNEDGSISATAYTNRFCFEIKDLSVAYSGGNVKTSSNILGIIPIVEFEMTDRMGCFEKVIPILNEINVINSDRINDIAQHVQSLLWMHNCQIDDEQRKSLVDGNGIIATRSNGDGHEAKIVYLSQTLDQTSVQTDVDYLQERVNEITSTPSWKEASGGSTTGAMQLSNGWQSLEISAKTMEQKFSKPSSMLLGIVKAIIDNDKRSAAVDMKGLDISDVEPHFVRQKNYDLATKANALATLINIGTDPLTAYNTVGLFADSEQAYVDSADVVNGIQKKLISESSNNSRASTDETGRGGANNDEGLKIEESYQPSAVAMVENT